MHNGRQRWYPLEAILEAWLDMIKVGKIEAIPEDEPKPDYNPWILKRYSDFMLEETITAFNDLVKVIENRMPHPPSDTPITGMVDEDALQNANIPEGFAHEFLRKVHRPRFKFIAPGLEVPTSSTFLNQPFFSVEHSSDTALPPILLFRSPLLYSAPSDADITGAGLPFPWPYSTVKSYPGGLYFSWEDLVYNNAFEDGCKLVLPFGIGRHGYARKSDGAKFGENTEDSGDVEPKDTHADLYQQGHNPFIEKHDVRLVSVLRSWIGMVERGDWQVGEEGIVGSIDDWRRADTEADWGKYVVPATW